MSSLSSLRLVTASRGYCAFIKLRRKTPSLSGRGGCQIPKMALKTCNNHRWPIVPPVSEEVVLVAGDGTSAQEAFREVLNRVTKAVDRNAGKTRKKPGWNIKGAPNAQ